MQEILTHDFNATIQNAGLVLKPQSIETLQINITKLCNQACLHCHVDASPKRTEQMDLPTIERVLEVLKEFPEIQNLDITGGAPELNTHFDYLVIEAKKLQKHVMVRHNLTVTFDGNPQTGESKAYLPDFFAEHNVEVISSLPCYQRANTDKQRGLGVFEKSIHSLLLLNDRGYGIASSGKILNLVYNPVGLGLPGAQQVLEADYKKELFENYGISFNKLFTITNMPVHRFKASLERSGNYDEYMSKIVSAFNPAAAEGVMCRSLLSVSHDGKLYDCDFNQMLDLQITNGTPRTIFDNDFKSLMQRDIIFDSHCFGCTAGAGSSCCGVTV
ncbi:MAG TPA: arsenosugar biosynthesis radical SAM (seleno)protein ArsS [Patescibacteria group bacterium]|nr:arsenosugar biosynthesis radical SAM (seleno)protein ArsS [Patescibacteria group bacterium]